MRARQISNKERDKLSCITNHENDEDRELVIKLSMSKYKPNGGEAN